MLQCHSVCTADDSQIVLQHPRQVLPVYVITFDRVARGETNYIQVSKGGSLLVTRVDHEAARRINEGRREMDASGLTALSQQPMSALYAAAGGGGAEEAKANPHRQLSRAERQRRGAAGKRAGALDQDALRSRLRAYFGDRAGGLEVLEVADAEEDDDDFGDVAWVGTTVVRGAQAELQMDEEADGEFQAERMTHPLSAATASEWTAAMHKVRWARMQRCVGELTRCVGADDDVWCDRECEVPTSAAAGQSWQSGGSGGWGRQVGGVLTGADLYTWGRCRHHRVLPPECCSASRSCM